MKIDDAKLIDTALKAARDHWGRTWKDSLSAAWASGRYPSNLDSGTLQRIRNTYGPSWLYKHKLGATTCEAKAATK